MSANPPAHPSRLTLAVKVALVVIVMWLIGVVALLYAAYGHVKTGETAVRVAQAGLKASTITDPAAPDLLAPVHHDFAAARRDLDNPLVAPAAYLPVVGRQLRAVRSLASAAEQVATIGQTALTQARTAIRLPHATGAQRVAAIASLADAATTADTKLDRISLGPSNALLGVIASKRAEFAGQLTKLHTAIHRGALAGQGVVRLFTGPSHLLLLAANNAEMRNGSGMFLSAAEIDFANGSVQLGQVSDTASLALPPGAVPLVGDQAATWGFLVPNEEWRNLALTPDFDQTAALAAQMWKAKTGNAVDGVLAIDIAGLKALLAATGPVQAGGQAVTAANVVPYLMHDQYVGVTAQDAGRELLGQIAHAALGAVEHGGYDTRSLAQQLPAAVSGRHLMLWSADPALESAWVTAGVAGALRGDALMVSVLNRGANKLDEFLSVSSDLTVTPERSSTAVTVTVHLANDTPAGQPPYVAGGFVDGLPANDYLGYVALTMPGTATQIGVDHAAVASVAGPEESDQLVAVLKRVDQGGRLDVVFSFVLPGATGHMQVEPSARIPSPTISVLDGGRVVIGPIPDDHRPRLVW